MYELKIFFVHNSFVLQYNALHFFILTKIWPRSCFFFLVVVVLEECLPHDIGSQGLVFWHGVPSPPHSGELEFTGEALPPASNLVVGGVPRLVKETIKVLQFLGK